MKMDDTIRMGVYEGETVRDCIKKYGRKSILEILRYYDLMRTSSVSVISGIWDHTRRNRGNRRMFKRL